MVAFADFQRNQRSSRQGTSPPLPPVPVLACLDGCAGSAGKRQQLAHEGADQPLDVTTEMGPPPRPVGQFYPKLLAAALKRLAVGNSGALSRCRLSGRPCIGQSIDSPRDSSQRVSGAQARAKLKATVAALGASNDTTGARTTE